MTMRPLLAAAAAALALVPGSARAVDVTTVHIVAAGVSIGALQHPFAHGTTCSFSSAGEPRLAGTWWTQRVVTLAGGPISAGPLATVFVTCSIHVGSENSAHNGADAVVVTSPAPFLQTNAAAGGAGATYAWSEGQPVYACTEAMVNGETFYFDAVRGPGDPEWSTSSGVDCQPGLGRVIRATIG